MRAKLAAATALVATVLLSGCTSSGPPADHATSRGNTQTFGPPTKAAGALPAGVVGATNVPVHVPNSARLRADVVLSKCSARAGGWAAAGTVHNANRTSNQRYLITVFFTTNRATVIGTAKTAVVVDPGQSRPWSLSAKFHAATPTLCVLRGVGAAGHRSNA